MTAKTNDKFGEAANHVIPEKVLSGDIAGKTLSVKTVLGGKISVAPSMALI